MIGTPSYEVVHGVEVLLSGGGGAHLLKTHKSEPADSVAARANHRKLGT